MRTESHISPEKHFDKHRINKAALQAFFNLAQLWQLNTEQQQRILGDIPRATLFKWKSSIHTENTCHLSKDTLERISYLLGIYKALNILLPTEAMANTWIHKKNSAPLFNNTSALDKMLAGNVIDLADVRRYLDAERG